MGQENIVQAFRKRMRLRGYTEISIARTDLSGIYQVSAVDPALRVPVSARVDVQSMELRCRGLAKKDR